MSKIYKFYSDIGHGWLAVKVQELHELNISHYITSFSYTKGKTVYLEEDCDAPKFLDAYKDRYGTFPAYVSKHTDKHSVIRSYDRYVSSTS